MKKVIIASILLVMGFGPKVYALDITKTQIKTTSPTLPTPTLPTLPVLIVPTLPSVSLQGSAASVIAVPTQSLVVPTLTVPTLPPLPKLTVATLPKVTLPVVSTGLANVTAANSDDNTSTPALPVLVAPVVVMPQLPELVVPTLPPLPTEVTVPAKKTKTQSAQSTPVTSPLLSVATPQELLDLLNANSATPELVAPQNAERNNTGPIRYLPYGAASLSAYLGYRLLRKPKVAA